MLQKVSIQSYSNHIKKKIMTVKGEKTMIKNRPLDHIGVAVTDVEATAAWYQKILGFTVKGRFVDPTKENATATYFLASADGSVIYELYQEEVPADAIGKIDHISYVSNDIEADYKYCVEQGYTICTDGIEGLPHFWEKGCRYFKILSPSKEQVEFCQIL